MNTYFINDPNDYSNFFVGINQIEIDPKKVQISGLVELSEVFLSLHKDTIVQFFNDRYILNTEHILHACYFVQKAFNTGINISKKKNLELLLYLAAKRQIKLSLDGFGVKDYNLTNKKINFCIISSKDNLKQVNIDINRHLDSKNISLDLRKLSFDKFDRIKKYFEISDNQILTILLSYGHKNDKNEINSLDLEQLYKALNDLICEKMALLSLEKS